jgi:glycosyltransferase 2 family protein
MSDPLQTAAAPRPSAPAKKSSAASLIKTLLLALAIALLAAWLWHKRGSFDWHSLAAQLRSVSIPMVLLAVAIIYACYWLRAMRWSVLLQSLRPASSSQVFPAQAIGFTAVALFGRLADLARPYIIARQLDTPVATQLAVYSVERAFDLGAAAILFSLTLAFGARGLPHHEAFARAGIISTAATLLVVIFAVALRLVGDRVAALAAKILHRFSPKLAAFAEARLLDLRSGFQTLATFGEFLAALTLSLVMWAGVAIAYLLCARAFRSAPSLAHFGVTPTMLLMATSIGGSVFQLPIVGWFTQIAVLAGALHAFFDVPLETATACGAVMFIVTYLAVIPLGLILARMRGLNLRAAAHSAEEAPAA